MKFITRVAPILILALALVSCSAAQTPAAVSTVQTEVTRPAQPTAPPATQPPSPTQTVAAAADSPTSTGMTYVLVPEKSVANYRVTEQLVKNDLPNDAVGKTSAITGSITLLPDSTIDKASSKFTVDLSKMQSDSGMRDNYVRRNTLQTDQYPEAVFVPLEIKGLNFPIPQSGSVAFQVVGDLTIKDVTKSVTWDVTGEIANGVATGNAVTKFTFADFSLNQPQVPVVLSVADEITLEVALTLQPL